MWEGWGCLCGMLGVSGIVIRKSDRDPTCRYHGVGALQFCLVLLLFWVFFKIKRGDFSSRW